jgi:Putative Actinobacterial Holin-X, holin superfamily III
MRRRDDMALAASSQSGLPAGLFGSLKALLDGFLDLAICEARQAGIGLAFMIGFGLATAMLTTAGFGLLVTYVVMALVEHDFINWPVALIVGAVLCFAGSAGFAVLLIRRVKDLSFEATRRQIGGV